MISLHPPSPPAGILDTLLVHCIELYANATEKEVIKNRNCPLFTSCGAAAGSGRSNSSECGHRQFDSVSSRE
ncbi:hypothetical protein J6590_101660 [Homalodisca vitripennis]|nr:hypothetical protein J6590_101660 [Homalodisca vitripennis]